VLRSLRYHNHPRTNQFLVEQSLDGLEEKFRVYNEDNLADALRERLHELEEYPKKWVPEILNLLLELSDRPIEQSKLADLEFLKPPEVHGEPVLKWKDLIAEDPLLREKSVWRNIDYTAESSDDEPFDDSDIEVSEPTESTAATVNDDDSRRPEDLAVSVDLSLVERLKEVQFWKADEDLTKDEKQLINLINPNKTTPITELQAIRQILFMLYGTQTSLYVFDDSGAICPNPGFTLSHISHGLFHDILRSFAQHGTKLNSLRSWTTTKQSIPLIQSFQDQIEARLRDFNKKLSDMQARFVAPETDVVVSLAEIQKELIHHLHPISRLSEIVTKLLKESYPHTFRYLELLYDETCTSQMAGDDDMYQFMGKLFFDCFQVYLRPLRKWMQEGELRSDDTVFFVSETEGVLELASLWQTRYILRKTKDGVLHAPKFLHMAASKIFTTGKSVIALKHLGRYETTRGSSDYEPALDFQSVCNPDQLSLVPFPDLFDEAFENWVQSKHRSTSLFLRNCLFDDCGLRLALDALEKIYFMADGATSGVFCKNIFDRLDAGKISWNDRFNLTEQAQSIIGELRGIIPDNLRVNVTPTRSNDVQLSRKTVKSLSTIQMSYRLPWAVQLILTPPTISTYTRLSTLLLQIRRASYLISSPRLLRDPANLDSSSDERALFYILRSRFIWFTSVLYNYLTDLVIRVNTSQMRTELADADDVDQMISIHQAYAQRLADQALLGSRLEPIHKSIITILDLTIKLCDARAFHVVSLTDSSMVSLSKSTSKLNPRRGMGGNIISDSSDNSDDDEENAFDFSLLPADGPDTSYADKMRGIKAQFEQLIKFVAAGLRGVARGAGEPNWEILAEKIECGMGSRSLVA
jgi:gamma-tubulin complex component 5